MRPGSQNRRRPIRSWAKPAVGSSWSSDEDEDDDDDPLVPTNWTVKFLSVSADWDVNWTWVLAFGCIRPRLSDIANRPDGSWPHLSIDLSDYLGIGFVLYMIRCRWGGRGGELMTKFGITTRPLYERMRAHSKKSHYWRPRLCGLWAVDGNEPTKNLRKAEREVKQELRWRGLLQSRPVPGDDPETELVCREDEAALVDCLNSKMGGIRVE